MENWRVIGGVIVRVIALFLLLVGATFTAITGVELYMILSNQVAPGEPLLPENLAPPYLEGTIGLVLSLLVLGVSSLLSDVARRLLRREDYIAAQAAHAIDSSNQSIHGRHSQ